MRHLMTIAYILLYGMLRPKSTPLHDHKAISLNDGRRVMLDIVPPAMLFLFPALATWLPSLAYE